MRHLDDEDLDLLGVFLETQIITRLVEMEARIMAAIDDLNAAVTNLNTSVDAAVAKLGAPVDETPVANAAGAVQAAADRLNAAVQ